MTKQSGRRFDAVFTSSNTLFEIAVAAHARARSSTVDAGQQVIIATLFCVAGLESLANTLLTGMRNGTSKTARRLAQFRSVARVDDLDPMRKWVLCYQVLVDKMPSLGHEPWQGVSMLVRLRNEIVHAKPTRYTWNADTNRREGEAHKLAAYLAQKRLIPAAEQTDAKLLLEHIQVPDVADWALRTTKQFLQNLLESAPEDEDDLRGWLTMTLGFPLYFPVQ